MSRLIQKAVKGRSSRAGRRYAIGQGSFCQHPKTVIYDQLEKITGFSRQKLHGFTSYEYAPTESVDCFMLWLNWRIQKAKDRARFSKLRRKYVSRFRAMGLDAEERRKYSRGHYQQNAGKMRRIAREKKARKKASEVGAIEIALRRRLYDLVRRRGVARKSVSAIALTGCSIQELRERFESQFASGMSWENYGAWHIDHRVPCAKFNLLDEREQRRCFHYSNLQPLWAFDNLSKGAKCQPH